MCCICGNHDGEHYVLVGGRGLVIYCSNDRGDVENFQSNMVAKTFIRRVSREFNRGERFCC